MVSTRRTILLIEDNPDVSDSIMTTLSLQGYAMRVANERQLALDLLRDHEEPDIAIVEADMPGMTIDEFLEAARKLHPNVMVILISDVDMKRKADELRLPFLSTPVPAAALLSAVDNLIQKRI